MFRSLSLALALVLTSPPTTPPESAMGVVEELVFPIEDIIGEVESLDGTESESQQGTQVTVALTSDVLFALDKWALTGKARQRLKAVADQVNAEAADGVVKIQGHTDDQGGDSYNLKLSLNRAEAVQKAMTALLTGAGVTLQAEGLGESRPKVPNVIDGRAVPQNRAKNRRVEIVYDVTQ